MSSFTPGPWEWDGTPWQYDKDNEAPWLMQSPWNGINSKRILGGSIHCESEADARLIAKAPDMLDMLKECHAALASVFVYGVPDGLVDRVWSLIQEAEGK